MTAPARLPVTAAETAVDLFTETGPTDQRPLSLVGVGHATGVVTSTTALSDPVKAQTMLLILGQLNLTLFLVNMVPLPPFDGGHIAVSLVQGVRDRVLIRRGRA